MAAEAQQRRRSSMAAESRCRALSSTRRATRSHRRLPPAGILLGRARHPPQLLRDVLEVVAVQLEVEDCEAVARQVVLVEVAAEAGVEVVWREVGQAAERRGDQQVPTRPQQPRKLGQRLHRVRDVLEHLGTHNRVDAVRLGDGRDVADDVELALQSQLPVCKPTPSPWPSYCAKSCAT